MIAVGFIVSGALLTEVVFSYSGVGYLLYTAVEGLDYPLIQGLLLIITVGVLAANLLVDRLYVLLDPHGAAAMTAPATSATPPGALGRGLGVAGRSARPTPG